MASVLDPGLNAFDLLNRQALLGASLREESIDSPAGAQTVFAGGSGETVLLLHGAGHHAGAWSQIVPPLLATGSFRLLIPDLAGHGSSAPASGALAMETLLAGLGAITTRCRDPITLVGNSLGAWLGMVWATECSARLKRLVAVDGGPVSGIRPDLTLTPHDRTEARRVWEALVDRTRWAVGDFVLDEMVRKGREGALARMSIAGMQDYLMDGRLGEVTTPVDLLWGESDELVPLSYARSLAAGLPNSRLTVIPACGHVPQMECPERFTSALLAVLGTPPPKGRAA